MTNPEEASFHLDLEMDLEDAVGLLVTAVSAFDSPRAYLAAMREAPEEERAKHLVMMSVALSLVGRATRAMKTAVVAGMASEGINVRGTALKLGEHWDKDGMNPEEMLVNPETIKIEDDILSKSFVPLRQGTKDGTSVEKTVVDQEELRRKNEEALRLARQSLARQMPKGMKGMTAADAGYYPGNTSGTGTPIVLSEEEFKSFVQQVYQSNKANK